MINSIELNKEKQIYYREIEPKMSLGQKGSGDPGAMLTSLLNKREKLRQDLRSIEKQVGCWFSNQMVKFKSWILSISLEKLSN